MSNAVVRVTPKGTVRWTVAMKEASHSSGGLVDIRGGDMLAFMYCPISDSGVELVRLTPATGEVVWRAMCKPLGVSHSKYRHSAAVTIEGDRVRVMSNGSFGDFIEVVDLATGKRLERSQPRRNGDDR
jgi:hypothetical protein